MEKYAFCESAAVRMLDRRRFPLSWSEETPACFVVRDQHCQALTMSPSC